MPKIDIAAVPERKGSGYLPPSGAVAVYLEVGARARRR
jgi:hypothetical protein